MSAARAKRRVFKINMFGDVGVLPKGQRSLKEFDADEAAQLNGKIIPVWNTHDEDTQVAIGLARVIDNKGTALVSFFDQPNHYNARISQATARLGNMSVSLCHTPRVMPADSRALVKSVSHIALVNTPGRKNARIQEYIRPANSPQLDHLLGEMESAEQATSLTLDPKVQPVTTVTPEVKKLFVSELKDSENPLLTLAEMDSENSIPVMQKIERMVLEKKAREEQQQQQMQKAAAPAVPDVAAGAPETEDIESIKRSHKAMQATVEKAIESLRELTKKHLKTLGISNQNVDRALDSVNTIESVNAVAVAASAMAEGTYNSQRVNADEDAYQRRLAEEKRQRAVSLANTFSVTPSSKAAPRQPMAPVFQQQQAAVPMMAVSASGSSSSSEEPLGLITEIPSYKQAQKLAQLYGSA